MNVVALVCARGGSRGIPAKNLRPLGGRPLVVWAIEQARTARRVSRVVVSTDSEAIAAVARAAGADVPFVRPPELARDDTPEWLVWRHALTHMYDITGAHPEALLSVPPTAPLRAVEDLDRAVDEFSRGGADAVISVAHAHRNPYFNMVKENPDGTVSPVVSPAGSVFRRQDAPPVYDVTTVAYVVRPEFVLQRDSLFEGRVRAVLVPVERALDIDTPYDLVVAEALLAHRTVLKEGPA